MEKQHLNLIVIQYSKVYGGLTERLKRDFPLKNGGNIRLAQHAETAAQFTKAWPFGSLPGENSGDGPPIGQAGVIEKMAKKQSPMGERPAIEILGG